MEHPWLLLEKMPQISSAPSIHGLLEPGPLVPEARDLIEFSGNELRPGRSKASFVIIRSARASLSILPIGYFLLLGRCEFLCQRGLLWVTETVQ